MGTLRVMVYEVGQPPYEKEIENTLEAMQMIVKGHIEIVPHNRFLGLFFVLNENGKNENMLPNTLIYGGLDVIVGDYFVCRIDGEDLASLTPEDILQLLCAESELGGRVQYENGDEKRHDPNGGR